MASIRSLVDDVDGSPLDDGFHPTPGGRNRFVVETDDLERTFDTLVGPSER